MRKKVMAALLSLMLIAVNILCVSAQPEEVTLTVSPADILAAEPGQTIAVPISISQNPGIAGYSLIVTYDPEKFTYAGAENGAVITMNPVENAVVSHGSAYVKITAVQGADTDANGILAALYFNVNETGTPTESSGFTVDGTLMNAELSVITFGQASGSPDLTADGHEIITGITISPNMATLEKGGTQQFTVTVSGNNNPSQTVTWTTSGSTSSKTIISGGGLLTVGFDENAEAITVHASSAANPDISGSAAVNILNPDDSPDNTIKDKNDGYKAEEAHLQTVSTQNEYREHSLITINGAGFLTVKNSGGIDLDGTMTAGIGEGFILSIPADIDAGIDENVYIMRHRGKVLPISLYDNGKIYAYANSDGTYTADNNPITFTDIYGHWAEKTISFTAARTIFTGMGDGVFAPDESLTRAMAATIFAKLDGADVSAYSESRFDDVAVGMWYSPYVEWVADKGIFSGPKDGLFRPDEVVTREQLALLLAEYIISKNFPLKEDNFTNEFIDNDEISWWAWEAVSLLKRAGIETGGPEGAFYPGKAASRGEAAALLANFIISLLKQ